MYRALVLAAMTVALATSTVMAQQAPAPRQNPATAPAPRQNPATAPAATGVNDSLFAMAAAEGNLAQLTLAQLGVERATNAELKEFSRKMVEQHNRLNQELASVAGQRGIGLSRTLDARAQFCAQALAGLSGEHFDRCYAKAQLHSHMEALAAFEAESERGLDPTMKAFAARALPQIKEHLKEIKAIHKKFENEKEESSPRASQR